MVMPWPVALVLALTIHVAAQQRAPNAISSLWIVLSLSPVTACAHTCTARAVSQCYYPACNKPLA